ncbi:unnamed protein product [Chondrus crispus]|uniref:Uncharacterized protein n=1 Tax=Chondrus crispus TaxID=2769 RepID=R7QNC5_CHOCR|nr:unnamed protein product [Chondrus crispus]CDF39599.1 unnamed protein product [Chondrus crispus]|eukprot:XP_005709893.1 unnamed protein product [Chondrus crispus]
MLAQVASSHGLHTHEDCSLSLGIGGDFISPENGTVKGRCVKGDFRFHGRLESVTCALHFENSKKKITITPPTFPPSPRLCGILMAQPERSQEIHATTTRDTEYCISVELNSGLTEDFSRGLRRSKQ